MPLLTLGALKALGPGCHGGQPALDGLLEGGVLAGVNTDVGDFQNHGGLQ